MRSHDTNGINPKQSHSLDHKEFNSSREFRIRRK